MKVGVIGLGMVGEAVAYGFERIGHEVIGFDENLERCRHPFNRLHDAKLVFLCLPTPCLPDGGCDTSAVESTIKRLQDCDYAGLVVIKSTVPPGTNFALVAKYRLRLASCPEFLRERARFSDFVEGHELCIAGVYSPKDADLIKEAHGNLPKHFVVMNPIEAELAKYFVNVFNAQRIVFANAFFDVCQAVGSNYTKIMEAVTLRSSLRPDYLECNEKFRAFGGACLPKDTRAFASFVAQLGLSTEVFRAIIDENERVKVGDIFRGDFLSKGVA